MENKLNLNHKHLIVNAVINKPPTDPTQICHWLTELVSKIGMKTVIGPFAHYCTAQDNEGLAALVGIETSHLSIHVWDKESPPHLRFDAYSCATFDINIVLQHLNQFEPTEMDYLVLNRNSTEILIEPVRPLVRRIAPPLIA